MIAPGADRYIRKAKELIQSSRLTDGFPGEAGKEQIITAYLNEIFYGHDAYGIAAAAQIYFGVSDLAKLTPAQAALLAGLPKSPVELDPYRYAQPDKDGHLVVPPARRRSSAATTSSRTSPPRAGRPHAAQLQTALDRAGRPRRRPAALVPRAALHLAGPAPARADPRDGRPVETGGYKVITTLDWRAQQLPRVADRRGHRPESQAGAAPAAAEEPEDRPADRSWINALRGKDLHNGALVALDYRTGDVLAYVGSAGYYRDGLASRQVRAEVRRRRRRRCGSRARPGSRSCTRRAFDAKRADPGKSSCSTSPREFDRASGGRRATPTSSSAGRSSSARRSSTR